MAPPFLDMVFSDVYRALNGNWKPLVGRIPVVGRTAAAMMEDE